MDPTPYDFMMRQEPKWVTDPVPDPLDSIPHPDNPGEPLRQPSADNTPAGASPEISSGSTHPFKGAVTDTDEITIGPGRVRSLSAAGPAEMLDVLEPEFAYGALVGNGTIWAHITGAFLQIENKTATVTDPTDGNTLLTLKSYRYYSETGISEYVVTPPAFGGLWGFGNDEIYVPILDFETVGGQVAITAQRVVDDIFVTDSYVTITAS
jgi:hypothetical protein